MRPSDVDGMLTILRELDEDEKASTFIRQIIDANSGNLMFLDVSNKVLPFRDSEFREAIGKAYIEAKPAVSLDESLRSIAFQHGWSPEHKQAIASATAKDFITVYENATSDALYPLIKASFTFKNSSEEVDLAITKTATEAIRILTSKSKLQKMRFGAYLQENTEANSKD